PHGRLSSLVEQVIQCGDDNAVAFQLFINAHDGVVPGFLNVGLKAGFFGVVPEGSAFVGVGVPFSGLNFRTRYWPLFSRLYADAGIFTATLGIEGLGFIHSRSPFFHTYTKPITNMPTKRVISSRANQPHRMSVAINSGCPKTVAQGKMKSNSTPNSTNTKAMT